MNSKDWIRTHGWLLPRATDQRPTHLLLDGGKARVPDDSAALFLNAYAIAIVKKLQPCVVELRTPVFKLFLDLDIKHPPNAPLDAHAAIRVLQRRAADFFDTHDSQPRAVVCVTEPRTCDTYVKAGVHVVWTNILATSATALAFRGAVVEDLEAQLPGACVKPWATVVDVCVFQANGLRMPYSGKGRGCLSTYVPSATWEGESCAAEEPAVGVAAVRRWVHELSIRTLGKDATPLRQGVVLPAAEPTPEGLHGTSRSLSEYEDVLPLLDSVLPVQFAGQRFTGIIKADSCFLLRSSSRYCINLGREHNSCGIYWILSLKGIRQACYCRCDTTEGRKYGLCKDFKGEIWSVPEEALVAFFGAHAPSATLPQFKPALLPSAKTVSSASLEDLLSRSRPPLRKARKRGAGR